MYPVNSLKSRISLSNSVLSLNFSRPSVFRSEKFSTLVSEVSYTPIRDNPSVASLGESPSASKLNPINSAEKKQHLDSKSLSGFLNQRPSNKSSSLPSNRTFDQSGLSRPSLPSRTPSPPIPNSSSPEPYHHFSNPLPSHSTSYQLFEPLSTIIVTSKPLFPSAGYSLDKRPSAESTSFTLTCPSLDIDQTTFSARWVRDSDVSLYSIDPSTRQKKHQSDEPDPAIRLLNDGLTRRSITLKSVAELIAMGEAVAAELGPCLKFQWEGTGLRKNSQYKKELAGRTAGSSIYSLIPLAYLSSVKEEVPLVPQSIPWVASDLKGLQTLWTSYEDFKTTPQALHTVLRQLATYGIAFIRNVPTNQTGNKECELRALANRVGELRHTFYGETWDVRSLGDRGRNVAYTDVPLGLHMDLLYFQNPPQLQFLHSLRARAKGGASYFVDSFRAAENVRKYRPDVFQKLATAKVPYHYINDAHHLEHSHPVIELGSPRSRTLQNKTQQQEGSRALNLERKIKHVNYSPPFQAPLHPNLGSSEETMKALTVFAKELRDPRLVFELTLKEGECVVFDNRRVLHARRGFEEVEDDGLKAGPQRWLKGCYVDGDAAWDRLRVLESEKRRGRW